jgi:hypothetical protein
MSNVGWMDGGGEDKWREDKIRLEDIWREDKISGKVFGGKVFRGKTVWREERYVPQSTVLKSSFHSLHHYRKGKKTADVNMEKMAEIKTRLMFY